jgi:aubergine-like protein
MLLIRLATIDSMHIPSRRDLSQQRQRPGSNVKEEIMKAVVGQSVLTRYNNKTYRIDDIAWDMNPNSTFEDHSGHHISYADYYR